MQPHNKPGGGAVGGRAVLAGATRYLTDLEVELAPALLRLEAEHGGERRAQRAARLHVHEDAHLGTTQRGYSGEILIQQRLGIRVSGGIRGVVVTKYVT